MQSLWKMLAILWFSHLEMYGILRYDQFCVGASGVSLICLVYVVLWISVQAEDAIECISSVYIFGHFK